MIGKNNGKTRCGNLSENRNKKRGAGRSDSSSTKDRTKRYAANVREVERRDNVQRPTNNEPGPIRRVDESERSTCTARGDSVRIRDEKREEVAYVGRKSVEEPGARRVELTTNLYIEERRR